MNNEQKKRQVFVSTFAMLAKLSQADGDVSRSETALLESFSKDILKLNDTQKESARKIFKEACRAKTSFEEHAKKYVEAIGDQPRMLEWMLDMLLQVACGDKQFSKNEEALIQNAAKLFGISKEQYINLKRRHDNGSLEQSYALLECDENASDETVINSYRNLTKKYDAASLGEQGVPEEFIEIAKKRSKEFREAFETISRVRKISLESHKK